MCTGESIHNHTHTQRNLLHGKLCDKPVSASTTWVLGSEEPSNSHIGGGEQVTMLQWRITRGLSKSGKDTEGLSENTLDRIQVQRAATTQNHALSPDGGEDRGCRLAPVTGPQRPWDRPSAAQGPALPSLAPRALWPAIPHCGCALCPYPGRCSSFCHTECP